MNKVRVVIILIFLFGIQTLIGQVHIDQSNDWDKIIIMDAQSGWSNFDNRFQIEKRNLFVTSLDKTDSIFKKANPEQIEELISLIKKSNDSAYFKEPLLFFEKDSLWLALNAETLWKDYTKKWKRSNEVNTIAINTIKDVKKANQAAWSLQGSHWTDDYPLVIVKIINKKDTLSAYTSGQYPYMLPWRINKKTVYDSRISQLIAQLIPYNTSTNKERLSGKDFNSYFIKELHRTFISDKENYLEAKNKFPRSFRSIEKEFEITKAEIVDMSSIEWGGDMGYECLEMSLRDSTLSKNIEFSTISGINEILNTKKSILHKKHKLIDSLKDNPVYKYTLNCENCLGEIHWVKSKSLSQKAKANFVEDLETNGIDKHKYDKKYSDAIFFELTENRNDQKSFSRWIFFKDGTLLLWELRGNYLMDLPADSFQNQGYICKEVQL